MPTNANIVVAPCKRTQHVGPNNVTCCWPTMLRPFAWAFKRESNVSAITTYLQKLQVSEKKLENYIKGETISFFVVNIQLWSCSTFLTKHFFYEDFFCFLTLILYIHCRIATQGRWDADNWVTRYSLLFSYNGVTFRRYKQGSRTKVCELRRHSATAY